MAAAQTGDGGFDESRGGWVSLRVVRMGFDMSREGGFQCESR